MARWSPRVLAPLFIAAAPVCAIAACGPRTPAKTEAKVAAASSSSGVKFTSSLRCDTASSGRERLDHDMTGAGRTDMVEVFEKGRVVCMELDSNHDGTLDIKQTFQWLNGKRTIETEEIDRNYDGTIDLWIAYEKGTIIRQELDTSFAKGKADEFQFFRDGKLKRIERDRNGDGKVDVWEYYVAGRLERMGVDLDFDGRVDIWYRDEIARAEAKKVAAAAAAASSAPAPSASPTPKKKKEAM